MKKITFFVLALSLICAGLALAQQPPAPPAGQARPGGMMGSPMGGMMGMCPAMATAPPSVMMIERSGDALALSADQKTKLTNVLTKSEVNTAKLRPVAQQASQALHEALVAPTFDAAKVNSLLAAAQKADANISSAQIQTWFELRAILTPAQVKQLSDMMGRRMGGAAGDTRQMRDRTRQPGTRTDNINRPRGNQNAPGNQ